MKIARLADGYGGSMFGYHLHPGSGVDLGKALENGFVSHPGGATHLN